MFRNNQFTSSDQSSLVQSVTVELASSVLCLQKQAVHLMYQSFIFRFSLYRKMYQPQFDSKSERKRKTELFFLVTSY